MNDERDKEIQTLVTEDDMEASVDDEVTDEVAEGESEAISEAESTLATSEVVSAERVTSWSYFAVVSVLVLLIVDFILLTAGSGLFWTDRTMYIVSLTGRTIVLLLLMVFGHNRFFSDRRSLFLVSAGIGASAGLVMALLRFIDESALWTFINLIVEPVDSALIGFASAYIVYYLTKHTATLLKTKS